MDIGSLLGTLMETLASLGLPVEQIGAFLEPIISAIMGFIGM